MKQAKYSIQGQMLLEEMKQSDVTPPDTTTYSIVMASLAKGGQPDQAVGILKTLYADYKFRKTNIQPGLECLNTILLAYANSDRPNAGAEAYSILLDMKKISDDGFLDVHPDQYSLSTGMSVLQCICGADNVFTNSTKLFCECERQEGRSSCQSTRTTGGIESRLEYHP